MWVAEGCGRAASFACPYHLWTYDLEGQLVATPEMERTTAFELASIRLKPVRCEVWEGFVAINFDEGAPPLAPQLENLRTITAPWNMGDMVTVHGTLPDHLGLEGDVGKRDRRLPHLSAQQVQCGRRNPHTPELGE